MTRYAIDPRRSKVVVKATSQVHDTTCTWSRVTGSIEATAATLTTEGAKAEVIVDMSEFDAGDFLKNRKLRGDLAVDKHPEARFELTRLRDVASAGEGFTAVAEGVLRWRGKRVELEATGQGSVNDSRVSATAHFRLDVRELGVQPPRFLMLKVEPIVAVEVAIYAAAG